MVEEKYELPEVDPLVLAEWLKSKPELVVLDVREPDETAYAPLPDERVVSAPMSMLALLLERALPPQINPGCVVVVMCHLGQRSAQVTYWMNVDLAYANVYNLRGGIDAYARQVDPLIRRY